MGLFTKIKSMFAHANNVLEGARPLDAHEQRAIALGAVYADEGGLPINALTMETDARTASTLLANAWDVTDRASYDATIQWLLTEGHRPYYAIVGPLVERAFNDRLRPKEAAGLADEAAAIAQSRGLDGAKAATWYQGWLGSAAAGGHALLPDAMPASIAAWDASRAVQVTRLAVDAGLVPEQEAWAGLHEAVALSRTHHTSWEDYGTSFLVGRAFWVARDPRGAIDQDLQKFANARDNMVKLEDSPWRAVAF